MGNIETLVKGLLLMTALGVSGCTSTQTSRPGAMREMLYGGVGMAGYLVSPPAAADLRIIAAVEDGSLVPVVDMLPNGYDFSVEGTMRGMPSDDVLKPLCEQADTNGDNQITPTEGRRFYQQWCDDYVTRARGANNQSNRHNLRNGGRR